MFKKLKKSILRSAYQKVKKRSLVCPDCGESIELPEEISDAGFRMFVHCSHCPWVGSLQQLTRGSSTRGGRLGRRGESLGVRATKPEDSKIKEAVGVERASWLIPAKKRVNFLMFFSIVWLLIVGVVTAGLLFGEAEQGGDMPVWGGVLFLGVFWAIGLGVGYAGLRMAHTELLLRIDGESVILTRKFFNKMWDKSFPREQLGRVELSEAYKQNDTPVYQLEIKNKEGDNLKFGSSLSMDETRWLLGSVQEFLSAGKSDGVDLAGKLEKGGLEELETKSFTIKRVGSDGMRMVRKYTAGGVLIGIGLVSIVADLGWMVFLWESHQGSGSSSGSSDRAGQVLGFLFTSIPVIFSSIGLLIGVGLIVGGRWAMGRRMLFEFGRDEMSVTTEWRGRRKTERYPKKSVRSVEMSNSGNVNSEARYRVNVLTENEDVLICGFEPEEVAGSAVEWIEAWIQKKG